jgi:signal transduction histidine kinase
LVVLYPEDRVASTIRQTIVVPLAVGTIAAVALAITVTLLARRVVRPIEQLQKRALAVADGDFRRLPLPERNDEIRDLSRSFDDMAARLADYAQQVRQNERLRTLGQLGGALAHQLRNFATGARMALDLHVRHCPTAADDESLGVVRRQLTLMESYLSRFLHLGQPRQLQHAALRLDEVAAEVVALLSPLAQHAAVELTYHRPSEPVGLSGDADALQQLLTNLATNAIEAARARPEGQRKVVVEFTGGESGFVNCLVRDTGLGPAPAVAERVFEPFVTEKPDGTGLGLAMARQIAAEHGGTLEWQRAGAWTTFLLRLPVAQLEDAHGSLACRR